MIFFFSFVQKLTFKHLMYYIKEFTCHLEEFTCHFKEFMSTFSVNFVNGVNLKDKIKKKRTCKTKLIQKKY